LLKREQKDRKEKEKYLNYKNYVNAYAYAYNKLEIFIPKQRKARFEWSDIFV